jgi:PadR family transcriptional regulator, regulatory protein PadR
MGGRVTYLGEFEQVVLLAIVRLGEDAYGTGIRREIEARTGRWVSIGAAYATLDRLVTKGYLRTRDVTGSIDRGGRARRLFAITPSGIAALEDARDLQRRMWAGIQLRRAVKKS